MCVVIEQTSKAGFRDECARLRGHQGIETRFTRRPPERPPSERPHFFFAAFFFAAFFFAFAMLALQLSG
jgi:hypothetical protein